MAPLCSIPRAWLWRILALALVSAWAGCASPPMGLNQNEWERLPVEQKAALTERQAELDRQRAAVAAQQRADDQAAIERAREERAAAYAHARYGDIVTITLEGGGAKLGGKLCRFEPVSIDLIRGERTTLTLRRHDKTWVTMEVEIELSADANTVVLAPEERHRFVAVNQGWERTRTYAIPFVGRKEQDPELKECVLTVRYKRLY